MWGRKSKRADRVAELEAEVASLHRVLADEAEYGQTLLHRCQRLADDLKAAQNALLTEAAQNDIRSEAIAHVRETIAAGMGLCPACEVNVHLDHTPEDGCPDPGCVCRIRDNDPTEASDVR